MTVEGDFGRRVVELPLTIIPKSELAGPLPGGVLHFAARYVAAELSHRSGQAEPDPDALAGHAWIAKVGQPRRATSSSDPSGRCHRPATWQFFRLKRTGNGSGPLVRLDAHVGGATTISGRSSRKQQTCRRIGTCRSRCRSSIRAGPSRLGSGGRGGPRWRSIRSCSGSCPNAARSAGGTSPRSSPESPSIPLQWRSEKVRAAGCATVPEPAIGERAAKRRTQSACGRQPRLGARLGGAHQRAQTLGEKVTSVGATSVG